jgi:hypothetical protein
MRTTPLIASMMLLAGGAAVADAAEVSRDVTINASPAEVWQVMGPFCAISNWYPGITTCSEEQIGGATHRRLVTQDGGRFLEKLLEHDEAGMSYSYTIEESPLPVADYRSTIAVTEADGKARVIWSSSFSPNGASEQEAVQVVGGIYDGGLEALRKRFGG